MAFAMACDVPPGVFAAPNPKRERVTLKGDENLSCILMGGRVIGADRLVGGVVTEGRKITTERRQDEEG